jgi:hypothetical protein
MTHHSLEGAEPFAGRSGGFDREIARGRAGPVTRPDSRPPEIPR